MRLTQTGTRALLLVLLGCGSSSEPKDAAPVDGNAGLHDGDGGERDGASQDGSPQDGASQDGDAAADDACDVQSRREAAFLANPDNVRCEGHDDCVIVGDCSNANFLAVSASVEAAAVDLVASRPDLCRAQDGPGFHAVCSFGTCVNAEATVACGQPENRHCPEGMHYLEPGCDAPEFAAGCYFDCSVDACPTGFACAEVTANPCLDEWGSPTCDACAGNRAVCQRTCGVSLSLSLDAQPTAYLSSEGAVVLRATMTNRTNAPLTFDYDAPCHGPDVTGLPGYDLWDACTAGACPVEPVPTTVTLLPGESRVVRETRVATVATVCNDRGIAGGRYTLGWSLANVRGASVCAATPVELTVESP